MQAFECATLARLGELGCENGYAFWRERLPASREGTRWDQVLLTLTLYRLIDPGQNGGCIGIGLITLPSRIYSAGIFGMRVSLLDTSRSQISLRQLNATQSS